MLQLSLSISTLTPDSLLVRLLASIAPMERPSPDQLRDNSPAHPDQHDQPLQHGRTVSSTELFGPDRELVINHDGSCYRLRITKSGKLILTK